MKMLKPICDECFFFGLAVTFQGPTRNQSYTSISSSNAHLVEKRTILRGICFKNTLLAIPIDKIFSEVPLWGNKKVGPNRNALFRTHLF